MFCVLFVRSLSSLESARFKSKQLWESLWIRRYFQQVCCLNYILCCLFFSQGQELKPMLLLFCRQHLDVRKHYLNFHYGSMFNVGCQSYCMSLFKPSSLKMFIRRREERERKDQRGEREREYAIIISYPARKRPLLRTSPLINQKGSYLPLLSSVWLYGRPIKHHRVPVWAMPRSH